MPMKLYHAYDAYDTKSPVLATSQAAPNGTPLEHVPPADLHDDTRLYLVAHLATEDPVEAIAISQHHEPDYRWHDQTAYVLTLHPGPYPEGRSDGGGGDRCSATPRSTVAGDVLEQTGSYARFLVTEGGYIPLHPRPAPELHFPLHKCEWRNLFVQSWDVALAWRLIARRPSHEPDGMIDPAAFDAKTLADFLGVDPVHALSDATDLRIPILVAPIPAGDNDRECVPIDGHHRLYKALIEHSHHLPAFRLSPVEAAVTDLTGARFGARTHATLYHTCGERITRYSLRRGRRRISWLATATDPLLTTCPRCAHRLTSGTLTTFLPRATR